jgi:DNA-binding LacI/PurR family transcriptional regulator
METRRVTMREVARRAGVHCTTVSRALLRDPTIPADTRDRIRRLADAMGYAPDPLVSALNVIAYE